MDDAGDDTCSHRLILGGAAMRPSYFRAFMWTFLAFVVALALTLDASCHWIGVFQ